MMRVRLHLGSLVAALAAGLPAGALADTELEAVEVEALMDAVAEQRYAAGRKVVFNREDIASLGGLSVSEVLRKLPGLERGADGMEGASASARGRARSTALTRSVADPDRNSSPAPLARTCSPPPPGGRVSG